MWHAYRASLVLSAAALIAISSAAQATDDGRDTGPTVSPVSSSTASQPAITGRLRNGVRFAILSRQGDEPGVGLVVRNDGGFIAERRPGERGLAHLIEHIVFLSPTNEMPDDFRHLVRIGLPLTFPAPSAGSTSWRESNYYLSTKTTAQSDLDALLALFRETMTELNFRGDAVDTARAEVLREMTEKKLGNEIYASYAAAVAPGSPNDVIDAQNSDDVPTADIATIRRLYHRLYQPENMMVVVVGAVDTARTKALIEKRFGSWQRPTSRPLRVPPPVFDRGRIRPVSFSALAEGRRTAMIAVVTPTPIYATSREGQARAAIIDMLATRAISDRLAASQPGSAPGKVGMFIENGEQGHRQIMLWDDFSADQWAPAVAGLRKVTCDLMTTGFSDQEWTVAKGNLIKALEDRTRNMAKLANVELAKDLSHALADGRDLILPDELLRFARTMLPSLDARHGSIWWQRQRRAGTEHIRVEAPELARISDPVGQIRETANQAVNASVCRLSKRQ